MDEISPDRILFECIERHPGIHFREAARRTGLTIGTAHEYLRELESGSLIQAQADGRYKRYFVRDSIGERDVVIVMAMRSKRARDIVRRLLANGGATQRDLAEGERVTRSAIARTMQSLKDRGIVTSTSERRQKRYRLVDPAGAEAILQRFRDTFEIEPPPLAQAPASGPPLASSDGGRVQSA